MGRIDERSPEDNVPASSATGTWTSVVPICGGTAEMGDETGVTARHWDDTGIASKLRPPLFFPPYFGKRGVFGPSASPPSVFVVAGGG